MHENPKAVDAAFVSQYGKGEDMERVEKLIKRNEVAKTLVETTYKNLIPELEGRAKETHELELKEWNMGFAEIEEAEDVKLYVHLQCLWVASY